MEQTINTKEQELLHSLDSDISGLKKELNETIKAIIEGGYSKYPILLAHEQNLPIAQKVIDKTDYHTHFNFSASTMEELIARKIISDDKKEAFKEQFIAHTDSFCILLVHPASLRFIFRLK